MTPWDRLTEYIEDYFPEPSYSSQDIRDWAMGQVPAWKYMDGKTRDGIIGDWENMIAPKVESWFKRMSHGFRERIRKFLRRV